MFCVADCGHGPYGAGRDESEAGQVCLIFGPVPTVLDDINDRWTGASSVMHVVSRNNFI